jgi:ribosomal protein S12 methylthiotransferase accessory factor
VTRLANVTGLDVVGVPVYVAARPAGRSLAVSQGKGIDLTSAKASALMEALEAWHAEHIELPLRYESMRRLARAAHVLDATMVAIGHLDPDRPTLWAEGWDFFGERPIWIPFDLVHVNFVDPVGFTPVFQRSTNGLASGNHLLEATVHAICELIERDAMSLWFLDPTEGSDKQGQVDARSIIDPVCREVLNRVEAADLLIGVFDSTTEIGVPCYQAVLLDKPGAERPMGYFWGFGCHLAPEIALSRALTEAVQCRLTEVTGAREDITPEDFNLNRNSDELKTLQGLLFDSPAPLRMEQRASLATSSFEGDLEVLRDCLKRSGITVGGMVDLTRPDIGLPVVKAVIPELEAYYEGEGHRPGPRAVKLRSKAGGAAR